MAFEGRPQLLFRLGSDGDGLEQADTAHDCTKKPTHLSPPVG
jgi:hypothetical protein